MPVVPFIPLIAAAVGGGATAYAANKASNANSAALAAQQPNLDAQTKLAQQAAAQSKALNDFGMPLLNSASSYYNTILRGSPKALTSAVAPEVGQVNELYKGANSNLSRMAPSGARDYAAADLNRQQVGQIAGIVPGLRANAASAVGNIGAAAVGQSATGTGQASGIYGNLLGLGENQRQFNLGQDFQNGNAFGRLISDALTGYTSGRRSSTGAGTGTAGAPPSSGSTTTSGSGSYGGFPVNLPQPSDPYGGMR